MAPKIDKKPAEASDAAKGGYTGQYLLFQLAGEQYAFDVVKAKEVLEDVSITPLPTKATFLSGVINLRGSIIPIVDLRKKFEMGERDGTGSVVIIEIGDKDRQAIVGALVDSVKGVARFASDELEAPPKFGMRVDSALVKAIAKRAGLFVIILDSELLFSERHLWREGPAGAQAASPEAAASGIRVG
jgi:purine-binding chemotaxis protein CheW